MRMMLVGAGGVGQSILKILKSRDPFGDWLDFVLIADYDVANAEGIAKQLNEPKRFVSAYLDAKNHEEMIKLIKHYEIDFVMDAATPFVSNQIFDAAYDAGVHYGNMGTWSVPKQNPAFGVGIEKSYDEPMTYYNFDRHQDWKDKNIMACICLGIDPGVVNVFAKYAALYEFDVLKEIHVKDGGNLEIPSANENEITFGFNVWTVLDEVMNPNVEFNLHKGGFIVEDAFAGEEVFIMPEEIGENKLIKVEHEETVTMPKYLNEYGLEKVTFKIALDPSLINALKVIDALGLRSLEQVKVGEIFVRPRDVVAACANNPIEIGTEMIGKMCVGIHCIGEKDGQPKEIFMYQTYDNQVAMRDWGLQAVVAQTGFGAALALELIAKGIWMDCGVYSPEYFDPTPFLDLMKETGFEYHIQKLK